MHTIRGSTINCAENVGHPISRCYIRTPDHQIIRKKTTTEPCEFRLDTAGQWMCGYNAVSPELVDVQQEIQVHPSGAFEGQVAVDELKMQCRHVTGKPIKTCMFVSPPPSQRPISVPATVADLKAGICSIQFKTREELELGTWKCIIQPTHSDEHYSLDIAVNGNAEEGGF